MQKSQIQDNRVIKKLAATQMDKEALAVREQKWCSTGGWINSFAKGIVNKPWGYEYLLFENDTVAVWILYLRSRAQTSMHCHPQKKTSITVLSGEALCTTLDDQIQRYPTQGIQYGKGVFHRTKSISEEGSFVMEIETPNDKLDLIRFEDDYGREDLGYESTDQMSFNVQNYNEQSFLNTAEYGCIKKRLGHCMIEVHNLADTQSFQKLMESRQWDTMSILRGKIFDKNQQGVFEEGDIIDNQDWIDTDKAKFENEMQVLLVSEANLRINKEIL